MLILFTSKTCDIILHIVVKTSVRCKRNLNTQILLSKIRLSFLVHFFFQFIYLGTLRLLRALVLAPYSDTYVGGRYTYINI